MLHFGKMFDKVLNTPLNQLNTVSNEFKIKMLTPKSLSRRCSVVLEIYLILFQASMMQLFLNQTVNG